MEHRKERIWNSFCSLCSVVYYPIDASWVKLAGSAVQMAAFERGTHQKFLSYHIVSCRINHFSYYNVSYNMYHHIVIS
jgi:hypothetical protein